jgi:hypothetical protein
MPTNADLARDKLKEAAIGPGAPQVGKARP